MMHLKCGLDMVIESLIQVFKTAQCYLLQSLCRWLKEKVSYEVEWLRFVKSSLIWHKHAQKVDGAGEEYNETKNFDPITRRHFTQKQIQTLLDFESVLQAA